jgi:hypothetical protein
MEKFSIKIKIVLIIALIIKLLFTLRLKDELCSNSPLKDDEINPKDPLSSAINFVKLHFFLENQSLIFLSALILGVRAR